MAAGTAPQTAPCQQHTETTPSLRTAPCGSGILRQPNRVPRQPRLFFRKSKRILRKPSNSETITVFFGNEVLRKPKPVLSKPKGLFRKPSSSETENRFSDTKKYSSETNVFGNKNGFLQKLKRILRMPPGQEYANCFPFFWK